MEKLNKKFKTILGKYYFYHKVGKNTFLIFERGVVILENEILSEILNFDEVDVKKKDNFVRILRGDEIFKIEFRDMGMMEKVYKIIKRQIGIMKGDELSSIKKSKPMATVNQDLNIENQSISEEESFIESETENESRDDNESIEILENSDNILFGKNNDLGIKSNNQKLNKNMLKMKENSLKNRSFSQEELNYKNVSSSVEFGDLRFFINLNNLNFFDLKRKAVLRIGKYFYPKTILNENMIDIEQYKDFQMFLRYKENLYLLDSDSDLVAGVYFLNGKLDLVINYKSFR